MISKVVCLFHTLTPLALKISVHKPDGRELSCDGRNLTHYTFILAIF